MHDAHQAQGLTVMGFPCNQFGKQEPGSNEEIAEFARSKYGVTFPMFAKVDVNGANAAPLYEFLRQGAANEDGTSDIQWNFTKFLVDRTGAVVKRYGPKVTPEEIEAELSAHL